MGPVPFIGTDIWYTVNVKMRGNEQACSTTWAAKLLLDLKSEILPVPKFIASLTYGDNHTTDTLTVKNDVQHKVPKKEELYRKG